MKLDRSRPSLTDVRVKQIAITHMTVNLVAVALFAIDIWMRANGSGNTGIPLVLSIVAIAMLAVSGWLGGAMVHEHGVGVDVSPSDRPAR